MAYRAGIRHLHLPNITPFTHAQTLQQNLVSAHLAHKAALSSYLPPHNSSPPAPRPTLLSFVPTPVYTLGRRETNTLSPTQLAALVKPRSGHNSWQKAEVVQTLRGGQVTFHGPGQLVIYPILDLKAVRSSRWPTGLTARCYVNVLEEATIQTLSLLGIKGFRTVNPGVWVDQDTKIAALGVHLRRNVASFGVGLNVNTDLEWFDRIVACGLEGKRMTSIQAQLESTEPSLIGKREEQVGELAERDLLLKKLQPSMVAKIWTTQFAQLLWGNLDGPYVENLGIEETTKLLENLVEDDISKFNWKGVDWGMLSKYYDATL